MQCSAVWGMADHLAVTGDVFGNVLLCAVFFSHKMSWMRCEIELSQFLRMFLPTLALDYFLIRIIQNTINLIFLQV